MALQPNKTHNVRTLLASVTATGAATVAVASVRLPSMVNAVAFTCDVTAAAADGSDTLDVKVQVMLDGSKWTDIVHFPQHAGDGGTARYIEKVAASPVFAGFEVGTALTAGNTRDLLGDEYRISYTTTSGSSASFSFSVTAIPM